MSWSVLLAAMWAIAGTATAFLPMRRQMLPGLTLLIVAPVLIVWLGYDFGWLIALFAAAGFVSMFRNPLRYFWARARGQTPQLPPELVK